MSQRTGIEFQPDRADTAAQNELLKQRSRWNKFLFQNRGRDAVCIWEDDALWHHRLHILDPLQQSTLKCIEAKISLTSLSRRIKKLKHLIRRGVPPELRGS
eukprot:gene35137-47210_t